MIAHASLATQSANLVRDCPVGVTFCREVIDLNNTFRMKDPREDKVRNSNI